MANTKPPRATHNSSKGTDPNLPELDPWGIKCGNAYEPFIKVLESNSIGELNVVPSRLTRRAHHYLSRLEADYHYCIELNPRVIDIREQYPLIPVSETVSIAKKLKTTHPRRGSGYFEITVDLLLTTLSRDGELQYIARSIKPSEKLEDDKVLARLALEQAACASRGIPWKLVTEHEITERISRSARWPFQVYAGRPNFSVEPDLESRFIQILEKTSLDVPLKQVISAVSSDLDISTDKGVEIFKHLICTRRLNVDVTRPLELKTPHYALVETFS